MSKVLKNCCESEGLTKGDLKSNFTNPEWMRYRNTINVGDSKYVEHVFSYIPSNTIITMKDRDGNNHSLKIVNDNVNTFQYN